MNKHDFKNKECPQNYIEGIVMGEHCTCPAQKEEWDEKMHKIFQEEIADRVIYESHLAEETLRRGLQSAESRMFTFVASLLAEKTSQISQAEARGREEANKCDECGGTDVVCAKGVMDSIRLSRTETITAFEEWAKEKEENNGEPEDNFQWNIGYYQALIDLLKFADSLKSNAPKV